MPQLSVIAFNRVGLALVIHRGVLAPPAQFAIRVEGITEVAFGVRRRVNDRLHYCWRSLLTNLVRDDAACRAVNEGNDECWLFLVPMKVNSSSISKVLTCPGTGGASLLARNFV